MLDDPRVPEHPIFAAVYDRALAGIERAGLADLRAELLSEARGRTLEIGAGTGHNLPHYPESVTELVLTEPDPHMAKRLRAHIEEQPPRAPAEVIEASAEDLPFDDDGFETVVATLVFCTVEDPARALAEVRRVLQPGGALLFLEHVRSQRAGLGRWQDRIERPWGWVAGGCHPNRATDEALAAAGFWIERLDRGAIKGGLPPMRPRIVGVARRPSAVGDDSG
jgi:ubiquinone/menaquinone biosynthesis C-methylase UbiE